MLLFERTVNITQYAQSLLDIVKSAVYL